MDTKPKTLTSNPTASEALAMIECGKLTRRAYLDACIAAIEQYEAALHAFAHIAGDPTAELDASEARAGADALLVGIPIGVKDVIETRTLPTEYNSPHYRGHIAGRDAASVAVLRAHGAVVLGKTATVEFASLGAIPATRNPHNPEHTPGGTSSGSAVAVATGMVPIALGTQTGGSTIRPASYCGVAGFKPTWGLVSTDGLKPYAPALDTISWMARSVEDLQRVMRCFRPPDASPPHDTLRIGYYETPYWSRAEAATRYALERTIELLERSGAQVAAVEGPAGADGLFEAQDTIMHGEGRSAFLAEYLAWPDTLHEQIRDEVQNAKGIGPGDLTRAYDYLARMRVAMDEHMRDCDAWLTPAVPGEAPKGLRSTGDAIFNRLWTALHVPAVTLPGYVGEQGLPVGIQLVAPRFDDQRLLTVAARVESMIAARFDGTA